MLLPTPQSITISIKNRILDYIVTHHPPIKLEIILLVILTRWRLRQEVKVEGIHASVPWIGRRF